MKSITELIIKLSEEYNLPVHMVLRDVHRVEEKLFDDYLFNVNCDVKYKTGFFYSAIGRVRNEYKENKKIIEDLKK